MWPCKKVAEAGTSARLTIKPLGPIDYDEEAANSAQEDFVIVIHTDEGVRGIGETNTNQWVTR